MTVQERTRTGLTRGSAAHRAKGHGLVRLVTVTAGLGALGGTAGLAWAVAPHPAAAPEAAPVQRLVRTPAPVPATLSRTRVVHKAVVRPVAPRRTTASQPVTTTGSS